MTPVTFQEALIALTQGKKIFSLDRSKVNADTPVMYYEMTRKNGYCGIEWFGLEIGLEDDYWDSAGITNIGTRDLISPSGVIFEWGIMDEDFNIL